MIYETQIRKIRLDLRNSQECIAALVGASQWSLSRWERNLHKVPLDKQTQFAKVYGCDVAELFTSDNFSRLACK